MGSGNCPYVTEDSNHPGKENHYQIVDRAQGTLAALASSAVDIAPSVDCFPEAVFFQFLKFHSPVGADLESSQANLSPSFSLFVPGGTCQPWNFFQIGCVRVGKHKSHDFGTVEKASPYSL